MKTCLLLVFLCLTITNSNAQFGIGDIIEGNPWDSTVISFSSTSILINDTDKFYIERTAKDSLWQIGKTQKNFFSAGGFANRGIMTDTVSKYPINANSSFVVDIDGIYPNYFNVIISFKHKYQTSSEKDGGYIEFSNDSGKTWNNIRGDCSLDSGMLGTGILTHNIYRDNDTLQDGTPAFSGISNGWQWSRLQFFESFPLRTTGTGGGHCVKKGIQLRFHFVSDTTADTLDGWIIDEIKIERDDFGSSVGSIKNNGALKLYPNPATTTVHFPVLYREKTYTIQLYNVVGTKVLEQPYNTKLDVSTYQRGWYYYRVSNGEHIYTGKLMLE